VLSKIHRKNNLIIFLCPGILGLRDVVFVSPKMGFTLNALVVTSSSVEGGLADEATDGRQRH
jgi:hypothetical protein